MPGLKILRPCWALVKFWQVRQIRLRHFVSAAAYNSHGITQLREEAEICNLESQEKLLRES